RANLEVSFELSAEHPQRRRTVPSQRKPIVSSPLDGRRWRKSAGHRPRVDGKRIMPLQRRIGGPAKAEELREIQTEPAASYEVRIGVVTSELLRRNAVQRDRTLGLVSQFTKVADSESPHTEPR